jgi:hypothetical protein
MPRAKKIVWAFAIRYENLIIDQDLAVECRWLCDVYKMLMSYANGLHPIPRAVLKERVEHFLEKAIPLLGVPAGAAENQGGNSEQRPHRLLYRCLTGFTSNGAGDHSAPHRLRIYPRDHELVGVLHG